MDHLLNIDELPLIFIFKYWAAHGHIRLTTHDCQGSQAIKLGKDSQAL
jgi:hypothetical protein